MVVGGEQRGRQGRQPDRGDADARRPAVQPPNQPECAFAIYGRCGGRRWAESMVRGDRTSGIVTTSGSGFWSRCGATGRGEGPPDRSAIGHDAVPSGRAGGRDQNPWSPEAGAERGAADRLPLGGSIVICPDRNASGAYGGGSFST